MSLSVCTLVRNRTEMLTRLVEGLGRCDVAPRELVVVRAGGDDPRPALRGVRKFPVVFDDLADADDHIAYSTARNRAASLSSGRHLCFLDADTIPGAGMVRGFRDALDATDAICIGDLRYLSPEPVGPRWTEAELRLRSRRHPARPPVDAREATRSSAYELIWGSCFAIRRDRFDALGGFDETFSGYAGEDTDLAIRCRDAGVPMLVAGAAAAYHQHHDVFEPPVAQLRATLANARRFRDKHGWWPMGGWLAAFRDLGLITWTDDDVRILREPTDDDVGRARRTSAAPFRDVALDRGSTTGS